MPKEYIERRLVALAVQLQDDNLYEVTSWLKRIDVQYSYDEIKSGGHLIVYCANGPAVVLTYWWIVFIEGYVEVMNNETFNQRYEPRGV